MRAALLLLLGCPAPPPTAPVTDTDSDVDADADADADSDADADADADADTDLAHTADTAASGTGHTGDESGTDTSIFAITCDSGGAGVPDCAGACWPASYVGDGLICDDGTPRPWGDPDFACAAYGWDGGDCPIPDSAHTGDTSP